MKNYPIWKTFIIFLVVLLAIIFSIPSFLYKEDSSNWYLNNKVNLGLDLQGGSYLLLEVQSDVILQEELENFSDTIRLLARENQVKINNIDIEGENLNIRFENNDKIKIIKNKFLENYRNVNVLINNNFFKVKVTDQYKKTLQNGAVKQSLEIVRKRIDESGTKEPLIQRSGKDRILLQLPGVKDPERIKDLLGKTAKLTFHMVDDEDKVSLKANRAPFGKIIVSDYLDPEIKYLPEFLNVLTPGWFISNVPKIDSVI